MNLSSLERIAAILEGRPPDRPAYTLTLSLYGARLTACPLTEYYRNPASYLKGQEKVVERFDPDILFAPFALTLEAEAFGSELIFIPDNPPNIRKPVFRNPEDFSGLECPEISARPGLSYLLESVRLLSKKYGDQKPVCAVLTAPVDLPALIMGIDMWIETLLFHEHPAQEILDKTSRHFIAFANALLDAGAGFIALPTVFTHPSFLYKKLIDERMLPLLHAAFSQVKGPIVLHHGGNTLVPLLTDYLALPNVAAFALDHRDSPAEARRIVGPERLLLGNLNGPTLSSLPLDKIMAQVNRILEYRKDDPRFIFCTSSADIPWNTPPETLLAIVERIRSERIRHA